MARCRGRRAALDVRRLPRRLHRRVPRSVEPRREHRTAPLRGDSDRDPDAVAATLAAASRRALRADARRRLEPHAARRELRRRRAPTRPRTPPTGRRPSASSAGTSRPSYRVEAVDTVGHWPAAYLPAAGIPIARGWFRQDDFPRNDLLYAKLDRDALPRLAPLARRALRRAARRAARLQRQGRRRALIAGGDIRPRAGVPLGAHDDLRRAVTAARS